MVKKSVKNVILANGWLIIGVEFLPRNFTILYFRSVENVSSRGNYTRERIGNINSRI